MLMTLTPALFMTVVTVTYILIAPEGFRMSARFAYPITAFVVIGMFVIFWRWRWHYLKQHPNKF